jgi:hypothetical protein
LGLEDSEKGKSKGSIMDYLCSECSVQLSKFEIELNTKYPIGKLYCEFCQNKKEREIIKKIVEIETV